MCYAIVFKLNFTTLSTMLQEDILQYDASGSMQKLVQAVNGSQNTRFENYDLVEKLRDRCAFVLKMYTYICTSFLNMTIIYL